MTSVLGHRRQLRVWKALHVIRMVKDSDRLAIVLLLLDNSV